MSEQKPSQEKKVEGNIADEFRSLSENLKRAFNTAWESEERQRIHQELEEGLNEVGSTLKSMAAEFEESPAGQEIKRSIEDIQDPERRREMGDRLRGHVVDAVRSLNEELDGWLASWGGKKTADSAEAPPAEKAEPEAKEESGDAG
jgi:Mg/Co/Ni transporter MgtE